MLAMTKRRKGDCLRRSFDKYEGGREIIPSELCETLHIQFGHIVYVLDTGAFRRYVRRVFLRC
jgi:hypothetical protein